MKMTTRRRTKWRKFVSEGAAARTRTLAEGRRKLEQARKNREMQQQQQQQNAVHRTSRKRKVVEVEEVPDVTDSEDSDSDHEVATVPTAKKATEPLGNALDQVCARLQNNCS